MEVDNLNIQLEEFAQRYKVSYEYHERTSSTNDAARKSDFREGSFIVAERQTSGRGQRGNKWVSEPGRNLTFTVILEPIFLSPEKQFLLSETVSLAVTDMLTGLGFEPFIKWPNDIYLGDRKVGGILIENDIMGDKLRRSIVGVGLNVNQREFGLDLPNPVSMMSAAGKSFDRVDVFQRFYQALSIRYGTLVNEYHSYIDRDYHSRLYQLEEPHEFTLPTGQTFTGKIKRVEQTGVLIVEHPDGSSRGYLFKEIEF